MILTILASGRCLHDDIKTYGVVGDVMAVNHVIADYAGPIKYAVCWWDKYLDLLMQMRALKGRNTEGIRLITRPLAECPPVNNSGLLALAAASALHEYTTVRVLGMPFDNTGHYNDVDPNTPLEDFSTKAFMNCKDAWEAELSSNWKHFYAASGNLLKYFKKL